MLLEKLAVKNLNNIGQKLINATVSSEAEGSLKNPNYLRHMGS